MEQISIFYKTEKTNLPMHENFRCSKHAINGQWIIFEVDKNEKIIVSTDSIIRISIKNDM